MKTVRVKLAERSYSILIGSGLIQEAGRELRRLKNIHDNLLVVSQKPVSDLWLDKLTSSLEKSNFQVTPFVIETKKSSEEAKSQEVFFKLLSKIASSGGRGRSLSLVALGGGVIGDLTGFAASIYRRGITYVQIPTTVTAQVDSAIGGKTGIDLPEGKNLLGTIYQPAAVLSDVKALETLPDRHWSDGFAEVIKYGMIRDAALFKMLEEKGMARVRSNATHLTEIISRCAAIKAEVVGKDELDRTGVRMVLNFGHTAGHAIESASAYSAQYTHGEAVGIGMLVACDIAKEMGIIKDSTLSARLETLLLKFNLPVFFKNLPTENVMRAMGYDKKAEKGKMRFILPVKLGKTEIVADVPQATILKALNQRKR